MNLTLPTDSAERKGFPLLGGVLRYFPAALAGVARWSKLGNDKHNPGELLHHSRGKSADHGDCILRHLMDLQDLQAAEQRENSLTRSHRILDEADALAWRALALSQELHERLAGAPLAPGAKLPMSASESGGTNLGTAIQFIAPLSASVSSGPLPAPDFKAMNAPDPNQRYFSARNLDIGVGVHELFGSEPQTQKPRIREVWGLKIDGVGYVDVNGKITNSSSLADRYNSKELALRDASYFGAEVVLLP